MDFFAMSTKQVFEEVASSSKGLSTTEAKKRLEKHGQNVLKSAKKSNNFSKFLSQFKDIMVIILLVSAMISLFFAVHSSSTNDFINALIIFGIVILNATLGFLQELKAENALENLKKLSRPFCTVLRDGEEMQIPTSDVVVGDVVVLHAGDVVPADLFVTESNMLKVDESTLTGESDAVEKLANVSLPQKTSLADQKNMCFASSTVVFGKGKGVVCHTGHNTQMGKIASLLTKDKKTLTPLQKSLAKLGEIITFVVLFVAISIFLVDVLFAHHSYVESFLTAVAIAVAAIPESLPAVVTIILSIGVTRLAKKNAIIKKLHAVETLGCCQVICSDKTGTITQNKMTVRELFVDFEFETSLTTNKSAHKKLLEIMTLCSDAKKQQSGHFFGDPTEVALAEFAEKMGVEKEKIEKAFPRENEIPFDSTRKLMSTINSIDGKMVQQTKGAVDQMLKRCSFVLENGKIVPITTSHTKKIEKANFDLAKKALRVIAFAFKFTNNSSTLTENNLVFVGLAGMIDPPRKEVFDAIRKCKKAGMKPVMITGDHKHTACAIAMELGMISSPSQVLEASQIEEMSDAQLESQIENFCVFARVTPEHKVRIVRALQKKGKIVAMTGDGVNDAPSVKRADIGIGMGKNGTEVTKSVSDMILADDNFATIIVAVEEGRKIFANIQKTIQFLLSCNIAEVLTIFFVTLVFPTHVFLNAVQILFINLITDTFPSIALGVDNFENDIMLEPPRNPKKNIISGRTGFDIVLQGVLQTVLVLFVYVVGLSHSQQVASTMAFLTINFIQLFHIFNVRSNKSVFSKQSFKNKLLNISFVAECAILIAVASFAPLMSLFGLAHLGALEWVLVFGASFSIVVACELIKIFENGFKSGNKLFKSSIDKKAF